MNKFMDKFYAFAERYLIPIADKIAGQRHIAATRDAMVATIPLSIVGGIFLILASPPVDPTKISGTNFLFRFLLNWKEWSVENAYALKLPFNMTMGLLGFFVVMGVAYNLSKHYKLDPLNSSIVAVVSFLLVSSPLVKAIPELFINSGAGAEDILSGSQLFLPITNLDARGMFTAIFIGILSVEIINFYKKKDIRVKMPEGVPPAVTSSFDTILPLLTCILVFYAASLCVQAISGKLIPDAIALLLTPAAKGMDSLLGILFISSISQIFWFFGLHGANITSVVRLPFMDQYLIENANAFTAGEPIVHFFTQPFWSYFMLIGGSGATLALCFLLFRSKSKQLSTLGKICIGPAIFNINEPIIFGLPIVLNPIMMIPFIFVPFANIIITYVCMSIDIISKGVMMTPWTTPAPIGAALGTMDWKGGALVVILIIIDGLLYYPFFKILEKQKLNEELQGLDALS